MTNHQRVHIEQQVAALEFRVANLERQLAAMGGLGDQAQPHQSQPQSTQTYPTQTYSSQPYSGQASSSGTVYPSLPNVHPEVVELLLRGKKIQAIKRVRELTGWGLKEAKDYAELVEQKIGL